MRHFLPFTGRVLIAAAFITFGIVKLFQFGQNVTFASGAGVPAPEAAIIVAIIVELGGGLLLLFNYARRFAALTLVLYLIILTFIFHLSFPAQLANFLKNLMIIGGLLFIAAPLPRRR